MPSPIEERLTALKDKYNALRQALGNELSKEFQEELNTTYKVEVVLAIINMAGATCTISEWVEMNNSLAMTGTLYERAETEIAPEISNLLHQFMDDKLTEDACIERARFLAMEADVRDMDAFMRKFTARLAEIKKHL